MTVPRRDDPVAPVAPLVNVIAGAVVLLVVVGAVIAAAIAFRWDCDDDDERFVVFLPGELELDTASPVRYQGRCVGGIVSVEPATMALQLRVEKSGVAPLATVATLAASDTASRALTIDNVLSVATVSDTQMSMLWSDSLRLRPTWQDRGEWRVPIGDSLAVRIAIPDARGGRARGESFRLYDGDVLVLEAADLEITWGDLERFVRVEGYLDTTAFRRMAEVTGVSRATADALLGSGSALVVSGLPGIGKRELTLRPSYVADRLVARVLGPERELVPDLVLDLESTIRGSADFLMSPAKRRAPPTNRYEELVDNVGRSLGEVAAVSENLREITDSVAAVGREGAQGLAGRLVFDEPMLANLDSILRGMASVVQIIDSVTDEHRGDGVLASLLLTESGAASLDTTLANVAGVTEKLDSSRTLLAGIVGDSMERDLRRTTESLASVGAKADSLASQADSLLKELKEGAERGAMGAILYGVLTAVAQVAAAIALWAKL